MAEENSINLGRGLAGEFITRSAEATFDLGMRLGESLSRRAILLLSGDLGAGKTMLAKGIASGLGIDPVDVTSPSFTLINVYEGRLRLYHVDLYRLDAGACRELGLEEIFDEQSAITVIEWAERLELAPAEAIRIKIEYLSDAERKITISGFADQASFDA